MIKCSDSTVHHLAGAYIGGPPGGLAQRAPGGASQVRRAGGRECAPHLPAEGVAALQGAAGQQQVRIINKSCPCVKYCLKSTQPSPSPVSHNKTLHLSFQVLRQPPDGHCEVHRPKHGISQH